VVFIAQDDVQLSPMADTSDPKIAIQPSSETTAEYALTLLETTTTTRSMIIVKHTTVDKVGCGKLTLEKSSFALFVLKAPFLRRRQRV